MQSVQQTKVETPQKNLYKEGHFEDVLNIMGNYILISLPVRAGLNTPRILCKLFMIKDLKHLCFFNKETNSCSLNRYTNCFIPVASLRIQSSDIVEFDIYSHMLQPALLVSSLTYFFLAMLHTAQLERHTYAHEN